MRKTTLLKLKTTFVIVLATLSLTAFGQATLPVNESFTGSTTTAITMPTGFTNNGVTGYNGALKFGSQGAWLQLEFAEAAGTLSFEIGVNNNFPGTILSTMTFDIEESTDGTTWTSLASYSDIAGGTKSMSVLSTSRYIKWIYTTKPSGSNIALRNITLSALASGVNNPSASNNKVYAAKGNLMVDTDADQTVEVYNATGQKLLTQPVSAGLNTISVQTKGLVFVKLGQSVSKVIL